MGSKPVIESFFHEATNTVSYLVACSSTGRAAVVDPVLDYDHAAGRVEYTSVKKNTGLCRKKWVADRMDS